MIVRALAGCGAVNTDLYQIANESIDRLIRRTSAKILKKSNEEMIEEVYEVEESNVSRCIQVQIDER